MKEKLSIEKQFEERKKNHKLSQNLLKKIFENLVSAIIVMVYFIVANIIYINMPLEQMTVMTRTFSVIFLLIGILILEFAYKKDSGKLFILSTELLVLATHALFIKHVITIYHFDFRTYMTASSYIFSAYYVLKAIIIYTKARIEYMKSFSDISEIVKDEPIVKEAKKRNKNVDKNKKEKSKQTTEKTVEDSEIDISKMVEKRLEEKRIKKNKATNNQKVQPKEIKKKKSISTKGETEKTNKKINKKQLESKKNKSEIDRDVKLKNQKIETKQEKIEKIQKPKSKRGRKKKIEVAKDD